MNLKFTNPILPIGEIKIPEEFSMPRLEKLKKCMDFYRTNGYFDRQIIVDSDKTLHDGYCAYITAVLIGVHKVKVLVVSDKPCNVNVKFTGSMEQLGRALKPVICKSVDSKPEPVKLYCVRSIFRQFKFVKGKIYNSTHDFRITDENGAVAHCRYSSIKEHDIRNPDYANALVPLVRRPAKVGEWVYVIDSTNEDVYRKNDVCEVVAENRGIRGKIDGVYIRTVSGKTLDCCEISGTAFLYDQEYLVLDGYHGDSE